MTTTITIRRLTADGVESILTKAVRRGALAINASIYTRSDGTEHTSGWVITHVPSGLALCRTRSVWRARAALRALLMCGDWNLPAPITGDHGDTSA